MEVHLSTELRYVAALYTLAVFQVEHVQVSSGQQVEEGKCKHWHHHGIFQINLQTKWSFCVILKKLLNFPQQSDCRFKNLVKINDGLNC